MRRNPLATLVPVLGITLLATSCAPEATSQDEDATSAAGEAPSADHAADRSGEEAQEFEDGGPQPDDLYAAPRPPASEDPPIYDYASVPTPESPFDHAPMERAWSDALGNGATPDDTGLIELDEPATELTIDGETYTVEGVIDPGSATPLYEDQLTQDGVGPLAEELTNVPWHDRREDVLQDNATATSCGEETQHLWVAFDTDEGPTCFEEPGGVTDPYFRGISVFCTRDGAPGARTVYMGFGGEQSFNAEWGDQTGWDMMYRGPRLEGDNSCYAFTVPVRGATTE
ncbi:hypothetical protein [Nesterenkonia suensis]